MYVALHLFYQIFIVYMKATICKQTIPTLLLKASKF